MPKLFIDFETRSRCELGGKEGVGAWRYSLDHSTDALCMAISVDGKDPVCYDLTKLTAVPSEWETAVRDGWEIHAFNAFFEFSIISNKLSHWPQPRLDQWHDTQAKVCAMALPPSLDDACAAVGLPGKDKDGARLIRWFSHPVSAGREKGSFRDPAAHSEDFQKFMAYCQQDVRIEVALDQYCPDLIESERQFWLATWAMNTEGVCTDPALISALQRLTDTGRKLVGDAVIEATEGAISGADLTNHAKISSYTGLASVAKKAVKEALTTDLTAPVRTVLEARSVLGKSSVTKLDAMVRKLDYRDNRLRGMFRYHGAATGRDTSLEVQVQNLPRGQRGMKADPLIKAALADDTDEFLRQAKVGNVFDPMGAVTTCLRGCFVAPPGKVLLQCDYAAIEPRVNAWASGEVEMLETFRKYDADPKANPDLYQVFAGKYYQVPPLTVAGDQRQFGKVAELQLGYGAGEDNFKTAAKDQYGLIISDTDAANGVSVYRATHRYIVASWYNSEDAMKSAIRRPGAIYSIGKVMFKHDGTHLWMRLPSGRKICYPFAKLKEAITPWGAVKMLPHYMCQEKGQWRETSTHGSAVVENYVQAIASDLLRFATLNLRRAGFKIVLRVHDEIVAEADSADQFATYKQIMLTTPAWAKDLPVNGAGWHGPRYMK